MFTDGKSVQSLDRLYAYHMIHVGADPTHKYKNYLVYSILGRSRQAKTTHTSTIYIVIAAGHWNHYHDNLEPYFHNSRSNFTKHDSHNNHEEEKVHVWMYQEFIRTYKKCP